MKKKEEWLMKRVFAFWVDWLVFGSLLGYWFALKYKLGIAREGADFVSHWNVNLTQSY